MTKKTAQQSFCYYLRKFRRERKLTLKSLAEQIGVSVNTIHRWENGERFPAKFSHIDRLADVFQVKVSHLFEME